MTEQSGYSRFGLFLLILLAGALYLLGNGRVSLWDRDEPRYAMASRWMLQSNDWVVPRRGWGLHPTEPRTAKPPLVYWLQATAMRFLGPTAFAARLPSAMAMTLTLLLLAGVLGLHFPQYVFWTLLILASSVLTIVAAKMCVIDSVQLLWIVICQICLYALWQGNRSWNTAIIFGIAMGVAGLAKGPVVIGVVLTTLLTLWLLHFISPRRSAQSALRGLTPKFLAILLIAAAINIPWLILVERRSPGFLSHIIGHDLVQRMQEPLEGHKGPPGFYLLTLFGTFYPWSLFLPLTIVSAWRHRDEPAIRFALAAVIGPWIMFECISTKMVHYVLPIFPPLAFLLADAILRGMQSAECRMQNEIQKTIPSFSSGNPREGRGEGHSAFIIHHSTFIPRWAISIWAIITTAIATALVLPARWFIQTPLWPAILFTFAGLAYAIVVLSLFWKEKLRAGLLSMGFGFIFLAILLFAFYLPNVSFLRISPNIADALNQTHATDARMLGYEEQSVAFYDTGRIDSLPGSVLHGPISAWPTYLVITNDLYIHLPAPIQSHFTIISRITGINYSKSIKPIDVLVTRKD